MDLACAGRCPEKETVRCAGGFQIASNDTVVLDYVFLQPGAWGRFAAMLKNTVLNTR